MNVTYNPIKETKKSDDYIPEFYEPFFTQTINDRKWEYKNFQNGQQDSMDFRGDWDD